MFKKKQNVYATNETSPSPAGGGSSRSMLGVGTPAMFLGFCLVASGAALALGPTVSWKVSRVSQQLSEMGLQSGMVVAAGLVLLAVGRLGRSVSGARHSTQAPGGYSNVDVSALAEEFVEDLVRMRGDLAQLAEQVSTVHGQQDVILQHVMATPMATAPAEESRAGGDLAGDAIYRLAASLDQLGAKLDIQLRSLFKELTNRIETSIGEPSSGLTTAAARPLSSPFEEEPATGPTAPAPIFDAQAEVEFISALDKLDGASAHPHPMASDDLVMDVDEMTVPLETAPPQATAPDGPSPALPAPRANPIAAVPRPTVLSADTSTENRDRLDSLLPDLNLNKALDRDRGSRR